MPNWNGLVLTKKGQLLQAKVGTGVVLALTKMKLGSGVLPSGTSLEDLTDLVTPEQNVGIAAKEVLTDQKICKISATITNIGLSAGYYVRELGVFANDPDDGEILYAVTSDSAPDYLEVLQRYPRNLPYILRHLMHPTLMFLSIRGP